MLKESSEIPNGWSKFDDQIDTGPCYSSTGRRLEISKFFEELQIISFDIFGDWKVFNF